MVTAAFEPTFRAPLDPRRGVQKIHRVGGLQAEDVLGFAAANALLITGMWLRHGALDELGTIAGIATAIGQLTALYGTFLALIQLLLMSRAPWLDAIFGRDRLVLAHRWVGFASVWLIGAHALFTTLGFALADGRSFLGEAWVLITTWEFVLMATVSLGLFIAVAITSICPRSSSPVLRELVRGPFVCIPGDRAGVRAPIGRGHRLRRGRARACVLGRPVRGDGRPPPCIPPLDTAVAQPAPPLPGGERGRRGTGCGLGLSRRSSPR